ncbi:MAG: 16S rRNA (uracil(1498)-N(3))-methyltransferase [Microbacteriaceae bacterium]|nr:16S rRNA (uracil(1498)-N(3))-methyltransferase [Microbacteriaceae bacterium]
MSSLYLNPALTAADAVVGGRVTFTGEESRHAVTVSRTRVGERIAVGNGRGVLVWGTVVSATSDEVQVEVTESRAVPLPAPELWLAQALAKGDRDEMAVQAPAELGVSGVIPWAAERSITKWEGAKIERGRTRWETIVREASKQAIREWVPVVEPIQTSVQLTKTSGVLLILDPTAVLALTAFVPDSGTERLTLVVGPEGGISPRELEKFEAAGAIRVRLGGEVLRTSTAGPAALAVLNAQLGRW